MGRAKLLDRRAIRLTAGDNLVGTDIFLHNLDPFTLEALRRAVAQGLSVSSLDFGGDDGPIAIIRFTQPQNAAVREAFR